MALRPQKSKCHFVPTETIVTEAGYFALNQSSAAVRPLGWSPYGLNLMRSWITWNGKNVLWYPHEYRRRENDGR